MPSLRADVRIPPGRRVAIGEEREDGARELHDRRSEDQRQNAGSIQLQRDVRGLTAVHSAANHALGILDGDSAFGEIDEHDTHEQDQEYDDGCEELYQSPYLERREQRSDVIGKTGNQVRNDTREDQHADAVADAVFGNALANPHRHRGTRREAEADGHQAQEAVRTVRLHAHGQRNCLNEAEDNRHVTGDLRDLLLALFAFLLHLLQLRDCHAEQLHDNRGVDVGGNAHRHDVILRQVGAGHRLHELQQRIAVQERLNVLGVDARRRNEAQESENQQHHQGVENLFTDLRDLPCVPQRLTHLRSPLLSRLPPRSSALRTRRTCSPEP